MNRLTDEEKHGLSNPRYPIGTVMQLDSHYYGVLHYHIDKMMEDRYAYMLRDLTTGRVVRESYRYVHKYATRIDPLNPIAKLFKVLFG